MNWTTDNKIEWFLRLPWRIEVIREEDGTLFARVPELPGAVADGVDDESLAASFWESLEATLRAYLDSGHPVPVPYSFPLPWERSAPPIRRVRGRLVSPAPTDAGWETEASGPAVLTR